MYLAAKIQINEQMPSSCVDIVCFCKKIKKFFANCGFFCKFAAHFCVKNKPNRIWQ